MSEHLAKPTSAVTRSRIWGRTLLSLFVLVCLCGAGGAAWAFWSANVTSGSHGASVATSVNAGQTPSVVAAGSAVTVSWAATTLANGQAVSGYQIKRYDATTLVVQTVLSACNGTVVSTSCVESSVPSGTWKYSVTPLFAVNWRGTESAKSTTVVVDGDAPTNSLALSNVTGGAWLSGTTIYYAGGSAGSLTLTNSLTDAQSGPASSQTTTLTGTTTGFTHTPSTVSTPTGGPYVSSAFSWVAGTSSAPNEAVSGRDAAGNIATTNLSFVNDSTAPSAGTVSYVNGSTNGTNVSVSFTTGTDSASGVGTRLLQRASATLSGITCGTYGSFATIALGTNPTSPVTDVVTTPTCNKYRYVVSDNVGNTDTATSANVAHTAYGAHWTFDAGSGSTAVDSSGNANTGTLQATAGWTTGKVGTNALSLTGATTSYVDVPNTVVDTSESYSVSTWLKHTNLTGIQSYASISGSAVSPFYLQLKSGKFTFTQYATDSTTATTTTSMGVNPVVGTWYHVVGVYNKTAGTIELYVNGVSQGSVAAVGGWQATGHTAIGRATWGGANVDFFKGAIDDTRFYERALTGIEVADLAGTYSEAISGTTGLVNFWRLGESSAASPMDDITAANNNGTYVNTPTVGVAGAIAGDANTAVEFDGTADYASAARQISADLSIELWVKSTQNFSNDQGQPHCTYWWQGAALIDADKIGPGRDFGLSMCSGKIIAGVGSPDVNIVTSATFNDGAWHHVVFTRTQTTGAMTLYVDGVSVGTATGSTQLLDSTATLNIARSTGATNYFAGSMDEIALYNTVLTPATVSAHYNSGQ